jgi:hypothetical protein
MPVADKITALLTGLTQGQVQAMAPSERQLLQDQLERVHRICTGEKIMDDARAATAPKGGVLRELRDGRGRQ